MNTELNQATIFLPVLAVVALTLLAFLRMAAARARAAKLRTDGADFYRTFQGAPEPDFAIVAVRHYGNLFEAPVLFYAACTIAFVLSAVTPWMLVWAWGFVVMRLTQSAIHLTINLPAYRGLAFAASWLFLIGLWVTTAMAVFARI